MLRLRFVVQGEERVVPLGGSRLRLGRGTDNDVVLSDVSVSRNHAELRREADGWVLHDLRSTNGVELNRLAVQSAPVKTGDRIGIGIFDLAVEELPGPRRLPPEPEEASLAPLANATIVRPLADFTATYGLETGGLAVQVPAAAAGTTGATGPAGAIDAAGEGYAHRMLGFLSRLGRVLITTDSADEVLARALDIAFEALRVERGFVLLRDDEGELVCELARIKDRVEMRPSSEVPVSRTMLEAVMRERVALVTYDAQSDQRLSGGESIRLHQIRAAMCAPLWSGERIIGVVQLDSPFRVGAFNERDLDFLTAVANYLAVAVERIRFARKAEFERQVRSRLERYHAPALIEQVLREGAGEVSRPRATVATVLFADLVGFTAFSEQAPPEEVADLLEAFLSRAVEAIFAAGGTLDKFIGDCVMAFFGAPVPQADHALRAVRAAVSIQRALAVWSREREELGQPAFRARVGINSGPVVVGDIGSRRRVDYTVLGNTVNVAARLEGVAPPGEVVLGPETHRLLAGAIPTEPLGAFQLKNLQQRLEIYRVADTAPAESYNRRGIGL
jgi:adenylate cyclase